MLPKLLGTPWPARLFLLFLVVGSGFFGWQRHRIFAAPEEKIWQECGRGESPQEAGKLVLDNGCYEGAMRALTKEEGVMEALAILIKVGERLPAGECHLGAHFVGWEAFQIFGSPSEAFLQYGQETACSAGYTHGVIEEYLKEQPPDTSLKDVALRACEAPAGTPAASPGGQWQCTHGFGHVVMALTNYDLPPSIEVCDQFSDDNRRYGCGYGVFMENILAGHFRKGVTSPWVKSEDPLFPCNDSVVPERYFLPCMEWAPTLINRYKTEDPKEALALCTSQDAELKRRGCVMGMGREIGTKNNATPEQISGWCDEIIEEYRVLCVQKSLENYVTTPDRLPRAVDLCNVVPTDLSEACAWHLGGRIGWMVPEPRERAKWCDGLSGMGRPRCYQTAGLPPPRQ